MAYNQDAQSLRAPPRYSTLTVATLPGYPVAEELDIGSDFGDDNSSLVNSRRRFSFQAGSSSSSSTTPWLSFDLISNAPASSRRPRYIGGEAIEGAVILNLQRPQKISSIVVLLRGRVVTSALDEGSHLFLEHSHTVWKAGSDEHHIPTPDESGLTGEMIKDKFRGEFELPFSFPFPTEFTVTSKKGSGPGATYTTPQTLIEKGIHATIVYQVIVKAAGGLLRSTAKVVADVLYIPYIRSPDLPLLRAQAYLSGTALSCPMTDPPSWTRLPSFGVRLRAKNVEDRYFNSTIEVDCTVYIANPTAYTRGTIIPCYLICKRAESDHSHGASEDVASILLETMTSQKCISASLVQSVSLGSDATSRGTVPSGHANYIIEHHSNSSKKVAEAVWWSRTNDNRGNDSLPRQIEVEGEIHLPRALLPSCTNPVVSVSYTICVNISDSDALTVEKAELPRDSASVRPSGTREDRAGSLKSKPMVDAPIEISTVKGRGPLPVAFTPAPPPLGGVDSARVRESDVELHSYATPLFRF